jgi:hypothetical protein
MITEFNTKKRLMEVKRSVFSLVRETLHYPVSLEMPYSLPVVT